MLAEVRGPSIRLRNGPGVAFFPSVVDYFHVADEDALTPPNRNGEQHRTVRTRDPVAVLPVSIVELHVVEDDVDID